VKPRLVCWEDLEEATANKIFSEDLRVPVVMVDPEKPAPVDAFFLQFIAFFDRVLCCSHQSFMRMCIDDTHLESPRRIKRR
jgi:hypothetical protein